MNRPDGRSIAIAAVVIAPLLGYWAWGATAPAEPAAPDAASPAPVVAPPPESVSSTEPTPTAVERPNDWTGSILVRVVGPAAAPWPVDARVSVTDGGDVEQHHWTSSEGVACFVGLGLGHAKVRVDADGFVPSIATVVVGPWVMEKPTIPLDAAVTIEGVVLDAASGAPIGNASVELSMARVPEHEHPPIPPAAADIAGRFRFGLLPAGANVRITAVAPGHGRITLAGNAPARAGDVARVDIRMARTGVVRGVVRGPDGAVVAGAWVRVMPSGDDPERTSDVTGPDGSYRLSEVPLGAEVVITAGATSWTVSVPFRGVLLTDERREATLDLALRPPTSLVVRVLGPSGDKRRGWAEVDGFREYARTVAEPITFENVSPGSVDVRAGDNPYLVTHRTVIVLPGVRNETEIRLDE